MNSSPSRPARSVIRVFAAISLSVAMALGASPASAYMPAVPAGVDIAAIVASPISVPAGETLTVDFGVPVQTGYSGEGWNVYSSGTAVSVTAPNTPGSTISVPVSAAGYSATLTLVAEGSAPLAEQAPAPGVEEAQDNPATAGTAGTAGTADAPATLRVPGRTEATPVDRSGAERINLEASINGNTLVATMGLRQAVSVAAKFADVKREGLKLRYLDVNGQIIEGVSREVDELNRTLTLSYPQGQTPDNPFIIEVVRENNAVAVLTLTDPNQAVAAPDNASAAADAANPGDSAETPDTEGFSAALGDNGILALAAVALVVSMVAVVAVVAAVTVTLRRRARNNLAEK